MHATGFSRSVLKAVQLQCRGGSATWSLERSCPAKQVAARALVPEEGAHTFKHPHVT